MSARTFVLKWSECIRVTRWHNTRTSKQIEKHLNAKLLSTKLFPLNTNIGMVTIGLVDPCKAGCTDLMLGCACHAWPTSNKTRLILASQPLLTTCPPPPSSPPSPPSPPSPQCYINAGRWYVVGPKFRNRQRKVRSETVEHCELDTIGQNGPQIGNTEESNL